MILVALVVVGIITVNDYIDTFKLALNSVALYLSALILDAKIKEE
jgi:hypothetical protein